MDIAILTIHNIHNFGSIFQAYALQKYLSNLGYNVQILNYNPIYFRHKKLKTRIGNLLYLKEYTTRKTKYNLFIKDNMKLSSQKFLSLKDLRKAKLNYDIYIAGGDQLWNSYHDCGRDEAFKLTFTDKPKISYATSMGRKNFTKEELERLKEQIKTFKKISVRESSSVELLNSVGLKNVVQVVDPVLLLKEKDYKKFMKPIKVKDRYLFVYLVNKCELLDKCVQHIAEKLNLKIVLFSGMEKKCKCDYFLKDLGPDEVLSYIANAEFVLSASFHASVFSVLFNKKFATLLPGENTNERIEDFLNWTKLSDRIIKDDTNFEVILDEINFNEAQKQIQIKKEFSERFLQKNIEGLEK